MSAVRAGGILQQAGATKAIVSMAGNGTGRQNVLVRADLLIQANGLQATSFQLEFLPSGTICNGTVNHIQKLGFDGTCHLPDHSHRAVHADWQLINGPDLRGTIIATTNSTRNRGGCGRIQTDAHRASLASVQVGAQLPCWMAAGSGFPVLVTGTKSNPSGVLR
jgi:hypothetical protein